jgi:hypothetical protein
MKKLTEKQKDKLINIIGILYIIISYILLSTWDFKQMMGG